MLCGDCGIKRKEKVSELRQDNLLVDGFCGGGGTSLGGEKALGRPFDIAINHDPDAILMHKTNHPDTLHFQESIWDVKPLEATKGRHVGLLWMSPDCKHFSKAKGGKPKDKNIRALPWAIIMWARDVRPDVIMAENVEEIQTWGPLTEEGYPIPERKGETFNFFIESLKKLDYIVEWKELVAADYGAPTIRKRWYMVARCDGRAIVWPKPTHSKTGKDGLKKWVPVSTVLDFSDLGKSIFGRKKQLAENTMNRIVRGIEKFVFNNPKPFLLNYKDGKIAPYMVTVNHSGAGHHYCNSLEKPFRTITQKNGSGIISPILIQYHSETTKNSVRGQSIEEPIMTIDSSPRYALASTFLTKFYKSGIGQSVDEPLHTITTSPGHFGEVKILMVEKEEVRIEFRDKCNMVASYIMEYYGQGIGQSLYEPLHTIVTKDRFALVTIYGIDYVICDITLRMLTAEELKLAQGFTKDYIIDRDYTGKAYPVSKRVARIGNSVVPIMSESLIGVNCSYLKVGERLPNMSIDDSQKQLKFT